MNRPLIVNPEAETDLANARAWYDLQRMGLGDEFLECVDEAFDSLRRTPDLFARVFDELRLVRVRRFPYLVVYRIDDDQITVVAVYHSRRDPLGRQSRT